MTVRRLGLVCFAITCAIGWGCGAQPASAPSSSASAPLARSSVDDCAVTPGEPLPEPLRIPYAGVARAARCQREVYTIMGGLTHFLGVSCSHCHQEPDYAADTHNKQIANWMARELVPRLQKRAGAEREVWCEDCHAGSPKLLGDPRRRDVAIEWMTTHLVDSFETREKKPPKCRDCHGGDLGSAEFHAKIILTELPGPPKPPAVESSVAAPQPSSSASSVPAPASSVDTAVKAPEPGSGQLPDYGKR